MADYFQPFFDFLTVHNNWSFAIVYLIAFLESIVGFGLFMPGVVLMFGIGALISAGVLDLSQTLIAASLGGFTGDIISYAIGRHYHDQLKKIWPFNKHHNWIKSGEHFFERHGRKSVFLARFIGPMRPIVPAVSGMLDMSYPAFISTATIANILWSPAYILPGVLFGGSMMLASSITFKLILFLALTAIALWILSWAILKLLAWYERTTIHYFSRFEQTSNVFIISLQQSPKILLVGTMSFIAFLLTAYLVFTSPTMNALNHNLYWWVQSIDSRSLTHFMVAITQLGDDGILIPLMLLLCLSLYLKGEYRALIALVIAALSAFILTLAVKYSLQIERPVPLSLSSAYSFPSGHTGQSAVLYGFAAILMTIAWPRIFRYITYSFIFIVIFAIGFSRLYLGVHWFSDIVGSIFLGLALTMISVVFLPEKKAPFQLLNKFSLSTTIIVFLVIYLIHTLVYHTRDFAWYDNIKQTFSQSVYPANYKDNHQQYGLLGYDEQYFSLHWTEQEFNKNYRSLTQSGWQSPPRWNLTNSLHWLQNDQQLHAVPQIPNLHLGKLPQVILIKKIQAPSTGPRYQVISLWQMPSNNETANSVMWRGKSEIQQLKQINYLLSLPETLKKTPAFEIDKVLKKVKYESHRSN